MRAPRPSRPDGGVTKSPLVVVAPHLDDAVLSYAGHMVAAVEAGRTVRVVTVFSAGDAAMEARRAEDLAALALIGAEPVHLGRLDAPFRSARYAGSAVLLAWDAADEATVHEVAEALAAIAGEAELVGPLGVGNHVDHRIVHRAVAQVSGRAQFYEDRPYAHVRHAVAARLRALGLRSPLPFGPVGHARSFGRAPWVRAWVDPQTRARCLLAAATPPLAHGDAIAEVARFDRGVRERMEAAVACYGSQLEPLYGGLTGWRVATVAHARSLGGGAHAERTWTLR